MEGDILPLFRRKCTMLGYEGRAHPRCLWKGAAASDSKKSFSFCRRLMRANGEKERERSVITDVGSDCEGGGGGGGVGFSGDSRCVVSPLRPSVGNTESSGGGGSIK